MALNQKNYDEFFLAKSEGKCRTFENVVMSDLTSKALYKNMDRGNRKIMLEIIRKSLGKEKITPAELALLETIEKNDALITEFNKIIDVITYEEKRKGYEMKEIRDYPHFDKDGNPDARKVIKRLKGEKDKVSDNNGEGLEPYRSSKDKAFCEKNKYNKNIQRDKIKFTETAIELDGLKFPRDTLKYDDIKTIKGVELNSNVFQENGCDYFAFNVVTRLRQLAYNTPTSVQRQQAADVFGGDYGLLGQILNYPKAGMTRSGTKRIPSDSRSVFWSSTSHGDGRNAYCVYFSGDGKGGKDLSTQEGPRSLILLQD